MFNFLWSRKDNKRKELDYKWKIPELGLLAAPRSFPASLARSGDDPELLHHSLTSIDKWDIRFINLAAFVSTWSKDPSTKVGAVITDPGHRVVSMGYNGLPQGVEDTDERLNNREIKYKMIVHAERNALLFAQRSLLGCTLYSYPFMPCAACAGMIVQSGIKRVIAPVNENARWTEEFELSKKIFSEAGVNLILVERKDLSSPDWFVAQEEKKTAD